jgi:hypothetical protein
MMLISDSFLRPAFVIVAFANILGGLAMMLFPYQFLQIFYNVPPESVTQILFLYHEMFWSFVVVLGLGYYVLSRNPREHQVMLLVGGIGKIGAALAWAHALYHYNANLIVLGGIAWDGGWGLFFLVLLWQYYRKGLLRLGFGE